MKIISDVTQDQVFLDWIKSELHRIVDLSADEIALIHNATVEDPKEAAKRKDILFKRLGRSAILDKLPQDVSWKLAEIEESDIDQIYSIPVFDWFLDTGKTFRFKFILDHLSPKRGPFPSPKTHHQIIDEIIKSGKIEGKLVVVTPSVKGKITIIDGIHRGSALLIKNQLIGKTVNLGISPGIATWDWSVEDMVLIPKIQSLNQYANDGKIW